jgi:hypothetical protein
MNLCLNCGADVGDDMPRPAHCGQCPPWECDGCGQMITSDNLCACWVDLTGMPIADIKALFAATDSQLSIDPIIGGAP